MPLLRMLKCAAGGGSSAATSDSSPIIDYRGLSVARLLLVLRCLLDKTGAPGVRLFVALEDLSKHVRKGSSIRLLTEEGPDGLMIGTVAYAPGVVKFRAEQASEKTRVEWTTEDVAEYFVLEATRSHDLIYIHVLSNEDVGEKYQGAFVSQARSCSFALLVGAIESHFARTAADVDLAAQFVWLDLFSANQPLLTSHERGLAPGVLQRREKRLTEGLHEAINRFEDRLIFFDSWKDPAPLKRTWCVWEIYGSIRNDMGVHLIFAPGEVDTLLDELAQDAGSFMRSVQDIDTRNAMCVKAHDKRMLDRAINHLKNGYDTVNRSILEWLSVFVAGLVAEAEQRLQDAEELPDASPRAALHNRVGHMYSDKGRLEDAFTHFSKFMQLTRPLLLTKSAAEALANSKFDEAHKLCDKALAACTSRDGDGAADEDEEDDGNGNGNGDGDGDDSASGSGPGSGSRAGRLSTDVAAEARAEALAVKGRTYQAQDRLQLALETYVQGRDAAAALARARGKSDGAAVASAMASMAGVYRAQDQVELALEWYGKSFSIYKKGEPDAGSEENMECAEVLSRMAVAYSAMNKLDRALQLYRRSMAIKEECVGMDDTSVADTLMNMGVAYEAGGQLAEAMDAYTRSYNIKVHALGEVHPSTADTLNNMGTALLAQGRLDEALEKFEHSIGIKQEVFGSEEHTSIATTLMNVGNVKVSQGKLDEALAAYQRSYDIKVNAFGEDHTNCANTLVGMAKVYRAKGDAKKALKTWERALEIYNNASGMDVQLDIARTLFSMAQVQAELGREPEALKSARGAKDLLKAAGFPTTEVRALIRELSREPDSASESSS